MTGLTKIFNVRARDLKNPVEGLETEKRNRIVIERDVLPIIFVPGIMGSRLKNQKGDTIWDPDDKWLMLKNYGLFWGASAKNRKQLMIGEKFDPSYLDVFNDDLEHNKVFADHEDTTRDKRGWGGVYWNSCGEFLQKLQTREWDQTVNLFFEFPVHVFGYNWTASNDLAGQKLATEIDLVIQLYRDMGRFCDYVILVTHSMGGLVARNACLREGIKDKVLGIVHGVQPTDGSPAAYWRMKAGFERLHSVPDMDMMQWLKNPVKILKHKTNTLTNALKDTVSAWVLGTDGEEVTALLGNMPGGLELLPNKRYKNNDGDPCWLELIDSNGNKTTLPKSDPYEEIYREQELYYRLVNPDWLSPGGIKKASIDKVGPWDSYLENLDIAETFHEKLAAETVHPETYQYYSSGIASADRVVFVSMEDTLLAAVKRKLGMNGHPTPDSRKSTDKSLVFKAVKGSVAGLPILIDKAFQLVTSPLTDSEWYSNRGGYRERVNDQGLPSKEGNLQMVTLQLPDGAGDGTVPESSARALPLPTDTQRTFCIADRHEFEGTFIGQNERLKPKQQPDFDEGYFDRGHEPVLSTSSVRFITFTLIENICRGEIRRLLQK
ncbi:MAG: PGAP1-like protein [Deltaproteobacteria bacterium ADurb.Bin151]|nr:MAG: PGAP1-like protein [Deltaproteobacteria bacterium ADurb.Bin151]